MNQDFIQTYNNSSFSGIQQLRQEGLYKENQNQIVQTHEQSNQRTEARQKKLRAPTAAYYVPIPLLRKLGRAVGLA